MAISIGEEADEEAIIQTLEEAGFEIDYRETQDRHHIKGRKTQKVF